MPSPANRRRSAAAEEGIAWLKTGVTVLKHKAGGGAPQQTVVQLSPDETCLAWTRSGLAKFRRSTGERMVKIDDILEVLVGRDSEVFKRQQASGGKASKADVGQLHLSFSLLLMPVLPPPPDGSTAGARPATAGARPAAASERETLDLSCAGEEEFGLWLAAMRSLIGHSSGSSTSPTAPSTAPFDTLSTSPSAPSAPLPASVDSTADAMEAAVRRAEAAAMEEAAAGWAAAEAESSAALAAEAAAELEEATEEAAAEEAAMEEAAVAATAAAAVEEAAAVAAAAAEEAAAAAAAAAAAVEEEETAAEAAEAAEAAAVAAAAAAAEEEAAVAAAEAAAAAAVEEEEEAKARAEEAAVEEAAAAAAATAAAAAAAMEESAVAEEEEAAAVKEDAAGDEARVVDEMEEAREAGKEGVEEAAPEIVEASPSQLLPLPLPPSELLQALVVVEGEEAVEGGEVTPTEAAERGKATLTAAEQQALERMEACKHREEWEAQASDRSSQRADAIRRLSQLTSQA